MTSSSGSANLLAWLTELREKFHSLDHWFLQKDTTRKQQDGRDGQGRVRAGSFRALSEHSTHTNPHEFTDLEAL